MVKPARTRAVAYIRVSTDKQADHGVSLDAQRAKVRAYAELYDVELVDVIPDAGESASTLDRPGLKRALGMLRAGEADALLVVKLDRLTRSVRDLGELVEKHFSKAALLAVEERIDTRTASGRLVMNVLASVSQWEREAIGERTSTAMRHMRASGRFTGGPTAPYGWKLGPDGRHLVEVGAEQETIARARALRSDGLPLAGVAATLAAEGRVSRTGRSFVASQVARMLVAARTSRAAA